MGDIHSDITSVSGNGTAPCASGTQAGGSKRPSEQQHFGGRCCIIHKLIEDGLFQLKDGTGGVLTDKGF